jgi:hypothetical protein
LYRALQERERKRRDFQDRFREVFSYDGSIYYVLR